MKNYYLFFLFLVYTGSCFSQSALLQEIKAHSDGIGLWWAGHNGWIIKTGDLVISTDILLDYDKRAIPSSIMAEELAEVLDISFITHGHKDHFNRNTSRILADKSKCVFVLPQSCVAIAKELDLPEDRIRIATPRVPFHIKGIQVEPLRAIHGNANFAIYYQANFEDCGYLITIDGKRFLQPGDSYLLEDHLFLDSVDVLFFSPTEHNMYIDRSVILINTLNPQYIFPQHHSTVVVNESTRFWAKGYQEEVKIRLSKTLRDRYLILEQGQKVLIE
jgi:L-ascorbate metabolism protein UlaG (beta-lactamase superfamily)